MNNITEKHQKLTKRIMDAFEEIKIKQPEHPLLNLVSIDFTGIYPTSEFYKCYEGLDFYGGREKYAEDLEKALR